MPRRQRFSLLSFIVEPASEVVVVVAFSNQNKQVSRIVSPTIARDQMVRIEYDSELSGSCPGNRTSLVQTLILIPHLRFVAFASLSLHAGTLQRSCSLQGLVAADHRFAFRRRLLART